MSDTTKNQISHPTEAIPAEQPNQAAKDDMPTEKIQNNKLGRWGVKLTVFYAIVLILIAILGGLALPSSYNELGDALAGAFSPVAFLWLVLGFFQQQKELQQNTLALNIQAEELKNSVDQYKEMVAVAKSQLNSDLTRAQQEKIYRENETKPMVKLDKLRFDENNFGKYTFRPKLVTDGQEARNVEVEFINGFGDYKLFREEKLIDSVQLPSNKINDDKLPHEVFVLISYESVIGKKYKYQYKYFDLFHGVYKKHSREEIVSE